MQGTPAAFGKRGKPVERQRRRRRREEASDRQREIERKGGGGKGSVVRRYKKERKRRAVGLDGWDWIELYGTLIRELGRNWHALTAGKLKYISATLEGRCAVRGNPAEIPCRDER